jgi:hypothetical protein
MLLLVVALQGSVPMVLDRSSSAPAIDASAAVEQARHGFEPVPGRAGALQVEDRAYQAVLDGAGVHYRAAGSAEALGIAVTSVQRGSQSAVLDTGAWAATEVRNRASRPLAVGMTEQVSARTSEIQWDVVLDRAPAGRGDLVVRADLSGIAGPVRRSTHGGRPVWQLPLREGERVRLGEVVVLDAGGAELHRALPVIDDGELRLVVPGDVLDGARYPVTVDPTAGAPRPIRPVSIDPAVAYDGTNHLVVWTELVTSFQGIIRGALVTPGGSVGDPFDLSNPSDPKLSRNPDVAWNGTQYLVVWEYQYGAGDVDIYARFVSAAGAPGTVVRVTDSVRGAFGPAVAGGGSGFLVSWLDDTAGGLNTSGRWNVWVSRLTNDGTKLDGTFGTNLFPTDEARKGADAAWNGTRWLVATVEDDDEPQPQGVYGHLVNATGPLAPSAPIPIGVFSAGERDNATVASDGNGWLVAYGHRPTSTEQLDVIARRIDASGVPVGGQLALGTGPEDQRNPSVAFNGVYFVAWMQSPRLGNQDLWGGRVTSAGEVLDGATGVILVNSPSNNENYAAVAPAAGYQQWTMTYQLGANGIWERPVSK